MATICCSVVLWFVFYITSADVGKYLTAQVAGSNTFGFALSGAVNLLATHA